jgi:hypothetical protein
MFRSTTLKALKIDPPATVATATSTDATDTMAAPWEVTDPILVEGKLTYENVKDQDDETAAAAVAAALAAAVAAADAAAVTAAAADAVTRELVLPAKRGHVDDYYYEVDDDEATRDSMPCLMSRGVQHQHQQPSPDSPLSVRSVDDDLSLKASDLSLSSFNDVPDLNSPPTTPVQERETKRPRIHVETVTDDDEDQDGVAFEPTADTMPAVTEEDSKTAVPPQLDNILQALQDLQAESMVTPTMALAEQDIAISSEVTMPVNDRATRARKNWKSLVGSGVLATMLVTGVFFWFPIAKSPSPSTFTPASTSTVSVLVVEPTAPTILAPITLDVETTEEEGLDEIMSVLVEAIVIVTPLEEEETETLDLDLDVMFNSSTFEARTEEVVLATEELVEEEVIEVTLTRESVLETPAKQKRGSSICSWILGMVLSLTSYLVLFGGPASSCGKTVKQEKGSFWAGAQKQRISSHQDFLVAKRNLTNHTELAVFLAECNTWLTKKAGRKCRSPSKTSSVGSDNYEGLTVEELKAFIVGFGGRKSGNKADLMNTLAQYYGATIAGFKNIQLQELLAIKGMPQSGKKQEMVDRLVEAGF